jgi:hypothetical protein
MVVGRGGHEEEHSGQHGAWGGGWDPLIDAQDEFSPSILVMGGF